MTQIYRFFLSIAIFLCYSSSFAQTNQSTDSADLHREIIAADSLLFKAFNSCDSLAYKQYFTEDLEFYHDKGGLTVSLNKEMESFRSICTGSPFLRRELIKDKVQVYPIKNYGAIEIGTHKFYHTTAGDKEKFNGEYKFLHVWKKVEGHWKIARVISYDHK